MSTEDIKSEIENLTSKALSEVIAFAINVRDQRESSAALMQQQQEDEENAQKEESQSAEKR